jgi:glycosyltransferase involved in cell wall biosynthesis
MKDPIIWCVVPSSKPRFLPDIFKNFTSQTYHNKKLVVVENGGSVGMCEKLGLRPDVLLTSKQHQSWAKNEALLYLKKNHPDDWWTTWDDDDYYGPKYLEELSMSLTKGDVVGKSNSFVKLTDDRLYWMTKPPENSEITLDSRFVIHGPTITARVQDSLLFEHLPFGEDLKFVEQMRELGGRVYATSKYNWCYMRYSNNHTWQISDEEFKFTNSEFFIDCGPLNLDIVNGLVEPTGKLIICNSVDIAKTMNYKQVQAATGGSSDEIFATIISQLTGEYFDPKTFTNL